MRAGRNQYAPMQGVPALREAIAGKVPRTSTARRYDPDTEVTVTSGGTEAIFDAVAAVLHPGDEAIVLEPCYDSYLPAIELSGGDPGHRAADATRTTASTGTGVRAAVTPRTRLLIINSPHNPAGAVLTAADIRELTALVAGTDILIVSDEVYEHIIFDGAQHESMARHPELAARSFIIGSFGKTYHMTGWKVGYAVAPAALTTEFRKVHQFVTFSTDTPVQFALADFLADAPRARRAARRSSRRKRDLFLRLMEGSRFSAAAEPRQLLPADGLLRHHDGSRRGLRRPPHAASTASHRSRPRRSSLVRLPRRCCDSVSPRRTTPWSAPPSACVRCDRASAPDAERHAFPDGSVRVGAGELDHGLAGAEPGQRQRELRDVVAGRAVGTLNLRIASPRSFNTLADTVTAAPLAS